MEFLRMRIGRWPALGASWLSLKVLILKGVGKDCFESVDLSKSIPNIEYLSLAGQDRIASVILPDMRHCELLQSGNLHDGIFWFPERVPFPRGLCNLNGWGSTIVWDRATLEEHFLNCAMHISFLR